MRKKVKRRKWVKNTQKEKEKCITKHTCTVENCIEKHCQFEACFGGDVLFSVFSAKKQRVLFFLPRIRMFLHQHLSAASMSSFRTLLSTKPCRFRVYALIYLFGWFQIVDISSIWSGRASEKKCVKKQSIYNKNDSRDDVKCG